MVLNCRKYVLFDPRRKPKHNLMFMLVNQQRPGSARPSYGAPVVVVPGSGGTVRPRPPPKAKPRLKAEVLGFFIVFYYFFVQAPSGCDTGYVQAGPSELQAGKTQLQARQAQLQQAQLQAWQAQLQAV